MGIHLVEVAPDFRYVCCVAPGRSHLPPALVMGHSDERPWPAVMDRKQQLVRHRVVRDDEIGTRRLVGIGVLASDDQQALGILSARRADGVDEQLVDTAEVA